MPTKQLTLNTQVVSLPSSKKKKKSSSTARDESHSLYPSGPTSTSTFRVALTQQTDQIRGGGGRRYNPDIEPWQAEVLKQYTSLDLKNPRVREDLYESSRLINLHTEDQLWKIIAQGWDYLDLEQCNACKTGKTAIDSNLCTCNPVHKDLEWPKQLEDTVIEATGRAMAIDTAFITRWDSGIYQWFTRNDIRNQVYVTDPYREIEEVYFNYGKIDSTRARNRARGNRHRVVGFLTQHSKDDERKAKQAVLKNKSSTTNLLTDTVYRDCVVIQPKPSPRDIFGHPMLRIELETATQKLYLRSLEMAYLHTGGMKKTTVIPSDASTDVQDTVVRDTQRGVHSRGVVMKVKTQAGKTVQDQILVAQQSYGPMPFNEINSMINEDAELSKQSVEGQAETGALGGQAPQVNFMMDEISRDKLYIMMEEIIRSINDVFFDIPAYEEKIITLESGRPIIDRKPTYRISFRKPQFITQPQAENPDQDPTSNKTNSNTTNPKPSQTEQNTFNLEEHAQQLITELMDLEGLAKLQERIKKLKHNKAPQTKQTFLGNYTKPLIDLEQDVSKLSREQLYGFSIQLGHEQSEMRRLSNEDREFDWREYRKREEEITEHGDPFIMEASRRNQLEDEEKLQQKQVTSSKKKSNRKGSLYWGKFGEGKKKGYDDSGAHEYAKAECKKTNQSKSESNSLIIEAHSVSLPNSDYITFEGNMFASGWYKYPEREEDQYVEYTPEEIRDVTNDSIKHHVLELDHSDTENSAFYDNRIGFSEIIGFDDQKQCDITRFHIRKDREADLREKKIIYQNAKGEDQIEVSPRFARRFDDQLGRKRLFLKNNAVVDPNTSMPRARLTGLDTSARKV